MPDLPLVCMVCWLVMGGTCTIGAFDERRAAGMTVVVELEGMLDGVGGATGAGGGTADAGGAVGTGGNWEAGGGAIGLVAGGAAGGC